jgi:hypothetical protein
VQLYVHTLEAEATVSTAGPTGPPDLQLASSWIIKELLILAHKYVSTRRIN